MEGALMRMIDRLACSAAVAVMVLAGNAQAAPAPAAAALKLERVVMLMRHSVRPPTKDPASPAGTFTDPWPKWSTKLGLLTDHGADGARLMGRYERESLAGQGLLPAHGCPAAGEVVAAASAKQRTIRTAESFLDGFAPGCAITVSHPPEGSNDDPIFHPADSGTLTIDAKAALAASQAALPPGGVPALVQSRRAALERLSPILGCCRPPACPDNAPTCTLADVPSQIVASENDAPNLEGGLSIASTSAQTLLLEYLEGKPMSEVGWGRASRADIERLLAFHSLKYIYEARPPYVGERAAAPVTHRILEALKVPDGARMTLLAGHDTNLAQLSGMLDLHWKIDSYPADDPAPGGALGFELLGGAKGARYVRAFYHAQSMDQLRNLTPLTVQAPPQRTYIDIPGCGTAKAATSCSFARFQTLVQGKLDHPAAK
jgi:4-phytase/acid phosphatase